MKHIWSEDPAGLAGPKATKPHRGNNCDVKLLLVQAGVTAWHITGRTLGDLGSWGKKIYFLTLLQASSKGWRATAGEEKIPKPALQELGSKHARSHPTPCLESQSSL